MSTVTPRPVRRVHAGAVEEFALDEFRVVEIPGGSIGVVRTATGFYAVRNRCPHMGADMCGNPVTRTTLPAGPFEYRLDEDSCVVRCPWHRWEFRIDDGRAIGGITRKRLVTYDVVVEDGQVYVLRGGGRRPAAEEGED